MKFSNVSKTAVLAACVAVGSTLQAQIDFDAAVTYGTGLQPDQTAVADFDGDGNADLAVTSDNPDKVALYLGDGTGAFGAPVDILLGANVSPSAVVAADWDGDSDMDLAVALKTTQVVQLLTNQGAGTFAFGAQYPVGVRPVDIEVAALNGDGAPDMAVSNRDGNSVTVLINNGTGSFATQTVGAGMEPRAVTSGDFDQDGDRDLAVAAHDSRAIQLLINNGGSFTTGGQLALADKPEGMAAADFNADGADDLVTSIDINDQGFLYVFLQAAGGTFNGPFPYSTAGLSPGSVVAHDLDLDGDADLATVNKDSNSMAALANLGAGTFGAAQVFATNGTSPDHLVAGDLDGNGSPDLISANRDSNNISVFRNRNSSPWTDLGFGLAGSNGVPSLVGEGTLLPNSVVRIVVRDGLALSSAFLVVGFTRLDAPLWGGTLVPAPDLILPGIVLDASGGRELTTTWPEGVPPGTDFFSQMWILDPAGVGGFSATNGLQGTAR